MSLEELNFDSLVMTSPDDRSGKPPIQPNPNLVNIGPFMIQKLNIPDGFYTNPATWSKSSTGSGHTEHEDDSYRIDRETRLEYWNSLHDTHNSSRHVSPSVNQIQVMDHDDPRLLGSTTRLPHDSYPNHLGGDLSYSSSNRTTPTAASANAHANERMQQQMQIQQRFMQGNDLNMNKPPNPHQHHSPTNYNSNNSNHHNLPRPVMHNQYGYQPQSSQSPSPINAVPRSPYAYEYDGVEFTGHSESRTTPRSAMPHYTPSAAVSAAAWRSSVTPATASSMQLRTTPTNAGSKYSSTPPVSPAGSYHAGFNAAAQGGVNGMIYQVQFKCALRNYILGSQAHPNIMIGDFVVVEADRGEDIGVVVEILPMKSFVERRIYMKNNTVDEENVIGRILRLASVAERQFLPEKFHDEENIVKFCRELAYSTYRLPMMIHDVEYQFDRHKLTIFYSSDSRVDFREFVRDLFSAYKARIWMKKIGTGKPVRMDNWASVALATGMQFTPDSK